MTSFFCQPRNDNNLFLVACILFCVDALYTIWAFISSMQLMFALLLILAVVTAVLFVLSYLGKVSLIAPFTALALRLLVEMIIDHAGRGGFFGFLGVLTAVYVILCLGGIIRFDFQFDPIERFDIRSGKPLLIAAAIFALLGLISVGKCLADMNYGVTILYVLDTICLFGAAIVAILALEQDNRTYANRDEFLEYARTAELEDLIYDDDFFEGMDEEFGFRKKPAPAAKAEAAAPAEEAKPAEKPETPFRPAVVPAAEEPVAEAPFEPAEEPVAETPFEPEETPAAAEPAPEAAAEPVAEAASEPAKIPAAEEPAPEEEPEEYMDIDDFIRTQDEQEAQARKEAAAARREEVKEQIGESGLEILAVIRRMSELKEQGIITQAEFEKKKRELLKRL